MNAKKIMGAVLVALLAAALFVGAGAATLESDTVFINQKLCPEYDVEWTSTADKPVDPEQPGDEPEQLGDEPVAPETPGFGALAALAGLGAVAVLLLRRE